MPPDFNDPALWDEITTRGVGHWVLINPEKPGFPRIKRRFTGNGGGAAELEGDGDDLRLSWARRVEWDPDGAGDYAVLYVVAWVPDPDDPVDPEDPVLEPGWYLWPIGKLRRGPNDYGVLLAGFHDLIWNANASPQKDREFAAGEWFGFMFGSTINPDGVRSDFLRVQHEGEQPMKGAAWRCFPDGRAPVVAMTPTGAERPEVWRDWLENIYPAVIPPGGYDGTHTPCQNEWLPEIRELAELNAAAVTERNPRGRVSAFWAVDQHDPKFAAVEMALRIIDETIHTEGYKIIGPTYDVQERWDSDDVRQWVEACEQYVRGRPGGDRFIFCVRAKPVFRYAGEAAAWEDWVEDLESMPDVFRAEISRSDGRPLWNTERFRHRNEGAGKDWRQSDFPAACRISRELRVGMVLGVKDHRGLVSDKGTGLHTPAVLEAMRAELGGELPPPPPPVLGPVPSGVGLIAFHGWPEPGAPGEIVHEQTDIRVWSVGLGPRSRTTRPEWNPRGVLEGLELFKNRFPDVKCVFGLHDSAADLSAPELPGYLAELIAELGPQDWRLDAETKNPIFNPGGDWVNYCNLIEPLVDRINESGGRAWGPGNTGFGELDHLDLILGEMIERGSPLKVATVHAYPEAKPDADWFERQTESSGFDGIAEMLPRQERILRAHGYEYGWISETGSTGNPIGVWQQIADYFRLRTTAAKRREYAGRQVDRWRRILEIENAPGSFWRGLMGYQITENLKRIDRLWGFTTPGASGNFIAKPVLGLFRNINAGDLP